RSSHRATGTGRAAAQSAVRALGNASDSSGHSAWDGPNHPARCGPALAGRTGHDAWRWRPSVRVVNAAPLAHPVTSEAVVGFVARGATAKLANLRRNPRATLLFRSG